MIPVQEYEWADVDLEGSQLGSSLCRECGRKVGCGAIWQNDGPVATSSGGRARCDHRKCGDRMPAVMICMKASPQLVSAGLPRSFQNTLGALGTAIDAEDAAGEAVALEWLRSLRMASGCAQ